MQIIRNVLAGIVQFPFGALGGITFVSGCFALLMQLFLWFKYNKWFTAHQLMKSEGVWHGIPSAYTNKELAADALSKFGPDWLGNWKGLEHALVWFLSFHPIVIGICFALMVLLIELLFGSNNLSD